MTTESRKKIQRVSSAKRRAKNKAALDRILELLEEIYLKLNQDKK